MSIDLNELAQHEAAWFAYGTRRASRLRWKKTTNADVAMGLYVQVVTKKIEAHDKRFVIVRWMIRRFTKIERERELLVYRLGSDVLMALKASSTMATLKAQQPNLEKITRITARASWSSWFKQPLNAFMGWVRQKTAELEPASQPTAHLNTEADVTHATPAVEVKLDTVAALERFREKVAEDKRAIVAIYSQCEEDFRKMSNMTTTQQAEGFDACFEPFKKKLRELQLYYHPDKALPERAKTVGLKHETLKAQVAIAFTEIIKPVYEAIIVKRDKLKGSIEQSLGFDRLLEKLDEIAKVNREQKEANLAFRRSVDELRESYAKSAVKIEEFCKSTDACAKGVDVLGEKIEVASEKADESERKTKENLRALSVLQSQVNFLMSAPLAGNVKPVLVDRFSAEPLPNKQPADGGVASLTTSPMLSTFPNAFFARTSPDACGPQFSAANKVDDVPSVLVH